MRKNVHQLSCQAIAGAANNQLKHIGLAKILQEKGILYAPDFMINSGGVINVSVELELKGYNPRVALERVNNIYDTLVKLFEKAKCENKSPTIVAEEIAEYHLKKWV